MKRRHFKSNESNKEKGTYLEHKATNGMSKDTSGIIKIEMVDIKLEDACSQNSAVQELVADTIQHHAIITPMLTAQNLNTI
ncbi:putative movement protein [Corchorus olitorius]|uniref:Movement protein n=1 Tax=Corchorus olitorius TaxID=93759 RepID=A0A1R3G8S9_9ROSI|nr:putative movement protein [Corchorus olitorius]